MILFYSAPKTQKPAARQVLNVNNYTITRGVWI